MAVWLKNVHASLASVPVQIATSRMSRRSQVQTRLPVPAAERPKSVVVKPANVLAHLARRHKPRRLPILTKPSVNAVATKRTAHVRLESVLAAAAPNNFFLWVTSQGVEYRLLDFADMARAPSSAATASAHDAATASTGVVDSTKIAPLESEKKTYA